jgi:hypothetical protein
LRGGLGDRIGDDKIGGFTRHVLERAELPVLMAD